MVDSHAKIFLILYPPLENSTTHIAITEYEKIVYICKITMLHKVAKLMEKMFTVPPVSEEPCTKDIVKYFLLFLNFIVCNYWFLQNPGAVYICKNLVQITWLLIFSGKWPSVIDWKTISWQLQLLTVCWGWMLPPKKDALEKSSN